MSEIIFPISIDENEEFYNNNYTLSPVIEDPLYEVEEEEEEEESQSIPASPVNSIFSGNYYSNSYDETPEEEDTYFYSKLQNRLYSAVPRDSNSNSNTTTSNTTNFDEYNFANIAQDNYKLWLSTV